MNEFCNCNWNEGAEAIAAMLPRLTVLRGILEDEPMAELRRCADALIVGDVRAASDACCRMTAALVTCGSRRVSGNLFKDYLLHALLTGEHPFAAMAADRNIDDAVYTAMRRDVELVQELMALNAGDLYRFVQERYRELRQRTRQKSDSATQLASAAWGGVTLRPSREEPLLAVLPAALPEAAPVWDYGDEGLHDSYAADEALEEMYHRLLSGCADSAAMTQDLWNFFAAYGTGVFLKSRAFVWENGALLPVVEPRVTEHRPLFENEYGRMLGYAIDFMRDGVAEPVLLSGELGMGKTTMILSIADELPEMRLVYVRRAGDVDTLMRLLSKQPLKFMVALDDDGQAAKMNMAARYLPLNVLLVAISSKPLIGGGIFTRRVMLKAPGAEGFIRMVNSILDARGISVPTDMVRAACAEFQTQNNGEATASAAATVAANLIGRM